ncbi:MAG: hypothetical protein KKB30_15440 [Proteobacteria bacterium]|nr:hypothetical protein [Pseudomonadota bacterium]MBU1716318.1 hypothetical protein [Pseudomonadota bacterium]
MKKSQVLKATIIILVCIIPVFVLAETFGLKKKRPKPHEFGNVVINNFSGKKDMAPVVFKHWLHRAKYSCRLCHVDIGFAMQAMGTQMTERDNNEGMYCGACHNGKVAFGPKEIDSNGKTTVNCDKCHSQGKDVVFKNDFYEFRKGMPQERFGNGIDWLKAEEKDYVKIIDFLEGFSIKRSGIKEPEEFDISASEKNMPDIIFSHKKHAKWNGCELCHPEIFGVKKGSQPYTMEEIFNGKYCGLCHDSVAFPNLDCQRCHTKVVM